MAFVWISQRLLPDFLPSARMDADQKHSVFPNTEVGYHFRQAMTDERAWKAANRCAGWISLLCGALFFLLLPCRAVPVRLWILCAGGPLSARCASMYSWRSFLPLAWLAAHQKRTRRNG